MLRYCKIGKVIINSNDSKLRNIQKGVVKENKPL